MLSSDGTAGLLLELVLLSTGARGRSASGHRDSDQRSDPEAHLQPELHHFGRHGGQH